MNPAKRKKLYRLELQKSMQQQSVKVIEEEKVIQKEQVLIEQQVLSETNLNSELKSSEIVETTDSKKDKKKKLSSQDI